MISKVKGGGTVIICVELVGSIPRAQDAHIQWEFHVLRFEGPSTGGCGVNDELKQEGHSSMGAIPPTFTLLNFSGPSSQ